MGLEAVADADARYVPRLEHVVLELFENGSFGDVLVRLYGSKRVDG